ncbi:hypothetical protein Droror1_Dr00013287 [Drosera rotundifolia]
MSRRDKTRFSTIRVHVEQLRYPPFYASEAKFTPTQSPIRSHKPQTLSKLGFPTSTMSAHSISLLSIPPISSPKLQPMNRNGHNSTTHLPHQSISIASPIQRAPRSSKIVSSKRIMVALSLPTANEIEVSKENLAKWSASAIKSFSLAELEAVKLKYPDTGTEAILLGILVEGMSFASKFLRSHGITFFKAQQAALDLLGKSHLSYYPPKQPPLTEPALKVLDMAVDLKQKSGKSGEVTPTHLLLALWALEASAGHKILENLGFNDDKAKELANSMDKEKLWTRKLISSKI